MSHDDTKRDDDQPPSEPNRGDPTVDGALREIFNPILEEPIPPNISALLDDLVQRKKQNK